jgi:hypothetical protein
VVGPWWLELEPDGFLVVALYVVAVCGPLLVSG